MCDLRPMSSGIHHIVGNFPTVTILDCCNQPLCVFTTPQRNFCDPRKVFADYIDVMTGICTEAMKVNSLIEVGIFSRSLASLRIARVIEAGAIPFPFEATSSGCKTDAGYGVR